jgi:hypothetical protein
MTCYPLEFAREARAAMYVKSRRCSGGFELCTSACKREATLLEPALMGYTLELALLIDKWLASVVLPDHCLLRGLCLPRLGIVWLGTSILFNPSILSPFCILVKINTFFYLPQYPVGEYNQVHMRIYEFVKLIVNLQHVSVTFCGHLLEGFTQTTNPMYRYQILNFEYVIHNVC